MSEGTSQAVQLALDLPFQEALSRVDFIVGTSNSKALDFIDKWPDWPARVAILTGPAGSGKTHLSSIWGLASGAQHHLAKNLTVDVIPDWLATGSLVIENITARGFDEVALFHLVNAVRGGAGFLLMTSDEPPNAWEVVLPDLISRLRAAIPFEIGVPDDMLMRQVFIKQFSDRQVVIDPAVIEYLINRIERSLSAVRTSVTLLDEAALSQGRPITRRLAAEVLGC